MNDTRDDKPKVSDEELEEGAETSDDTLDTAHKMGLYQDADEEHPHELDLAKEIEKAEKDHAGITKHQP